MSIQTATLPSIPMLDKMERRSSFGEGIQQAIVRSTQRRREMRNRRRSSDGGAGQTKKSWRQGAGVAQRQRIASLSGQPKWGDSSSQQQEPAANENPAVVQEKAGRTMRTKKSDAPSRRLFRRSKFVLQEELVNDPDAALKLNTTSLNSLATATTLDSEEFDDRSLSDSEESTQECETAQEEQREKRVRFLTNENGEIAPDFAESRHRRWFEKPDAAHLHITKEEFQQIISDVRSYSHLIKTECPEIVNILINMFQHKDSAGHPLCDEDAGILHAWSSSHGRGLEDHLMVPMKQHRDQARSRIIKFQEKMISIGCVDFSRALRERSCMESKKSASFARLLAIGDALEAEKIYHGKTSRQAF